LAVGGGTPTYLSVPELETLFALADQLLGSACGNLPASVETSPETADEDKLAFLRARGVTRISLGVQSFLEAETSSVGRPQAAAVVHRALERIRSFDFATLNLDLIYGLPGQTIHSWLASLESALRYLPEELYIYPLYIRPLTGLGRSSRAWDDLRLECYRVARELLLSRGYEQVSMRMFRAAHAPGEAGPAYCCQDDGMIGLGCGARSYTREVHYATEYGVRPERVREILAEYASRSSEAFARAEYGFRLNADEQRRRFVLQSLLQVAGLSISDYRHRFGSDPFDDLPLLLELETLGLATRSSTTLTLTETGLERSDTIGPWLYSPAVQARMETYEWH
jgi:oxygen-independent coproporphyrinogen-3 oxidase